VRVSVGRRQMPQSSPFVRETKACLTAPGAGSGNPEQAKSWLTFKIPRQAGNGCTEILRVDGFSG